jgi:hypothetical protein
VQDDHRRPRDASNTYASAYAAAQPAVSLSVATAGARQAHSIAVHTTFSPDTTYGTEYTAKQVPSRQAQRRSATGAAPLEHRPLAESTYAREYTRKASAADSMPCTTAHSGSAVTRTFDGHTTYQDGFGQGCVEEGLLQSGLQHHGADSKDDHREGAAALAQPGCRIGVTRVIEAGQVPSGNLPTEKQSVMRCELLLVASKPSSNRRAKIPSRAECLAITAAADSCLMLRCCAGETLGPSSSRRPCT